MHITDWAKEKLKSLVHGIDVEEVSASLNKEDRKQPKIFCGSDAVAAGVSLRLIIQNMNRRLRLHMCMMV